MRKLLSARHHASATYQQPVTANSAADAPWHGDGGVEAPRLTSLTHRHAPQVEGETAIYHAKLDGGKVSNAERHFCKDCGAFAAEFTFLYSRTRCEA